MLNQVVSDGCSCIKLFFLCCQSFFLQLPCLCCCLITDFGALDGDQSVTDLQPDLAGQLLEADLTLAELKQIPCRVGLGDAILQGNVELDPYHIVWEIALENLAHHVTVASQQRRVWCRNTLTQTVQPASQPIVLEGCNQV